MQYSIVASPALREASIAKYKPRILASPASILNSAGRRVVMFVRIGADGSITEAKYRLQGNFEIASGSKQLSGPYHL